MLILFGNEVDEGRDWTEKVDTSSNEEKEDSRAVMNHVVTEAGVQDLVLVSDVAYFLDHD